MLSFPILSVVLICYVLIWTKKSIFPMFKGLGNNALILQIYIQYDLLKMNWILPFSQFFPRVALFSESPF